MKRTINRIGIALAVAAAIFALGSIGGNTATSEPNTAKVNVDNAAALLTVGRGMIWADCELYATVGTPTSFSPSSGPFDNIYEGATFKNGVDMDYNGGRWHVYLLKNNVDGSKYADACSVDDLDMNDFMPTSTYFECPLQPRRGRN